jgi:anti-sigma regulatory factor (Ser/Thr protein kinase)
MPVLDGYDVSGTAEPAELTGGDTFDLSLVDAGLLVVLADATGHGIAPALSVTQMQAMVRMALRLGAELDTMLVQINNQLAQWLPEGRFITAFIGVLDAHTHHLRFQSAGQAPILHFQAESGTCAVHKPTSFPLGAMPLAAPRPAAGFEFQPGDMLVLLSDGVYEYRNQQGEEFGVGRVERIVAEQRDASAAAIVRALVEGVQAFGAGARQEDDITAVIVKRENIASRLLDRRIEAVEDLVAFAASVFAREGIDHALQKDVDFALEELFTNMVKYGGSTAPVRVAMRRIAGGVEATLTDVGVEPFDVTRSPEVDASLPIEAREPGGLGLHLVRRIVDSLAYDYDPESRESRITFRKTTTRQEPRRGGQGQGEEKDARD